MRAWIAVLLCLPAAGQQKLTLDSAVAIALKSNPRLAIDRINAMVSQEVVNEVRSGLYPAIFANTTAAGATTDSRIAAGGLNNPIIFNRYAAGASFGQLITDFGRTANLVQSTRLRARSQQEAIEALQAQVVLAVHRAYYSALRAMGVLRVAEETEKSRGVAVEQVTALAKSNLKSTLDVTFAQVNLSEAKLTVLAARNERLQAMADLSLVLGFATPQTFELEDVPALGEAPPAAEALIAEAKQNRAELTSLRTERQAAATQLIAERKLTLPTLSALGAAGVAPVHDDRLKNRYAAAAINLNIPVFNGGLFQARRREAELRVQAIDQRIRDLEGQIAREVTVAVTNGQTAFERIAVTAQLLEQAKLSADLAQERYALGLSSIVELSQAQLNQTAAEIRNTAARYDYLAQRAMIDFQAGRLK
ncbi:MAG: TolC family protein [Bryobacteraceae bacterium]